jgi:hypothetical protein
MDIIRQFTPSATEPSHNLRKMNQTHDQTRANLSTGNVAIASSIMPTSHSELRLPTEKSSENKIATQLDPPPQLEGFTISTRNSPSQPTTLAILSITAPSYQTDATGGSRSMLVSQASTCYDGWQQSPVVSPGEDHIGGASMFSLSSASILAGSTVRPHNTNVDINRPRKSANRGKEFDPSLSQHSRSPHSVQSPTDKSFSSFYDKSSGDYYSDFEVSAFLHDDNELGI